MMTVAKADAVAVSDCEVVVEDSTATTLSVTGDASALVAWGVDPLDADGRKLGLGLVADTYCLLAADYTADTIYYGNCAGSGVSGDSTALDGASPI
jgi:hypothetical protein